MPFKLYTNIVTARRFIEKPVIMSSGGKFICFRGRCSLRFSLAQRLGSARERGEMSDFPFEAGKKLLMIKEMNVLTSNICNFPDYCTVKSCNLK
jgi:hypothetical protein